MDNLVLTRSILSYALSKELKVNFDVEPASEKGASVSAKPARKGTGSDPQQT